MVAVDLSPTAVARARENLDRDARKAEFVAARSIELPFCDESFDLIVAADGLYSWDIEKAERVLALREIHRVLSRGGHVIFTEHTRRTRFGEFVGEIEASPLTVAKVFYLYDRPSYQLESWLKAVQRLRIAMALRQSVAIARALSRAGRLFGTHGARHVCVIAQKN